MKIGRQNWIAFLCISTALAFFGQMMLCFADRAGIVTCCDSNHSEHRHDPSPSDIALLAPVSVRADVVLSDVGLTARATNAIVIPSRIPCDASQRYAFTAPCISLDKHELQRRCGL